VQPSDPIVVRVIEAPAHETTVADILISALGVTGLLLLAAALFGLVLGALLIARRRLRDRRNIEDEGTQRLGLTGTP
jgi:ABC-type dipeptide/oligopeptide/nickel transport system permease component